MEIFNECQLHYHGLLVLDIWGKKNLEIKDVLARECELCPYSTQLRLQSDSNPSHFQLHTQKPAVLYKSSGKGNRKKNNEDKADNFGKGPGEEFVHNGRGVENRVGLPVLGTKFRK